MTGKMSALLGGAGAMPAYVYIGKHAQHTAYNKSPLKTNKKPCNQMDTASL